MKPYDAIAKIAANLAQVQDLLEVCRETAEGAEIQFSVTLTGYSEYLDSINESWQASGTRC